MIDYEAFEAFLKKIAREVFDEYGILPVTRTVDSLTKADRNLRYKDGCGDFWESRNGVWGYIHRDDTVWYDITDPECWDDEGPFTVIPSD